MPEFTNQLRWQTDLQNSPSGTPPGSVIYNDLIIVAVGSSIFGLDRYTGQQKFKYTPTNPTLDPRVLTIFGGQIIATDDQNDSTLYVVNMTNGTTRQFVKVQGYVTGLYPIDRSLFIVSQANVYEVGFSQRRWQILKTSAPNSRAPAAYDDDAQTLYIPTQSSSIQALALPALQSLWTAGLNGQVNYTPYLEEDTVYVGTWQNTVYSIDTASGHIKWQSSPLPVDIAANIAAGNGDVVYAPGVNKIIYVLDKTTGQMLDQIRVDDAISASIMVNPLDDILYIPAGNDVYAYAAETGNELKYNVGTWPYLLGTNGSDIYAGAGSKIYAINFSEALKKFSIESHLIQDFELDGGAVAQGSGLQKVPYYNTEIFLHNPDKTPLANTSVRLWATADTTVKIGGTSTNLSHTTPINLQTDRRGRLRIESRAQGISTPGICLWAPFLDTKETIVIYPDQGIHNKLAVVNGDTLASATGYDEQPILTSQYQGDSGARNQAADAIANALGMTMSSQGQQNAHPNAKRGLMPTTDYDEAINRGVYLINDPSQLFRPLTLASNWQLNLTSGATNYSNGLSTRDVDDVISQMEASYTPPSDNVKRSVFDDLWDALESGGAKVVSAIVYAADQAGEIIKTTATVIIDGVKHFFKDVLMEGIEHAILLVQGILNEIVENIQKALEWLSYVFSWDAILQKHEDIKNTFLNALDSLKTTNDQNQTFLDRTAQSISTLFDTLKDKVDDVFNDLRSGIGQDSFNTHRDPKQEVLPGGSKSTWLMDKVNQNVPTNGSDSQKRSVDETDPTATSINITSDLLDVLATFIESLKDDISEDVFNTFHQLVSGFQNMSASDFLAGSLAAVLTLFQGVTDITIDLGKNLVVGLINVLNVLIKDDVLKTLITAELPIPLVKDLYTYLTGSTMSLLDIIALLIAIPASIIERAAESFSASEASSTRQVRSTSILAKPAFYATILFGFWGIGDVAVEWGDAVEAGEEGEEQPLLPKAPLDRSQLEWKLGWQAAIGIGFPIVLQGLLLADLFVSAVEDPDTAEFNAPLWVLATIPIVLDIITAIWTKGNEVARYERAGQIALLVNGVIYYIVLIVFTGVFEKFRENVAGVLFNVFPMFFSLIKLARNIATPQTPNLGRFIVAGVDFAFNIASLGAGLGYISSS